MEKNHIFRKVEGFPKWTGGGKGGRKAVDQTLFQLPSKSPLAKIEFLQKNMFHVETGLPDGRICLSL
jgi:hypothetical protein